MKMLSPRLRASVVSLALVALMLAGCAKKPAAPGTPPPPPKDTFHVLSDSAYQIAIALDSGEKEFENLYSANIPGVSDDDYSRSVILIFQKAVLVNQEYIANLRTLNGKIDLSNKQQVIAWSNQLFASLDNLLNEGVLGIKNPQARANLQATLQGIPGAINLIADALGIQPPAISAQPAKTSLLDFGAWAPSSAHIRFTEVNYEPANRSGTDRARGQLARRVVQIPDGAQAGSRNYRRATAPGGRPAQRTNPGQDAGILVAAGWRENRSSSSLRL